MDTTPDFRALLSAASDRHGLARFVAALGLEPADDRVPATAWAGYGLADAPELRALRVVGRSGSLDALLMETAPGTEADRVARLARRVRSRNPARLHLYLAAAPDYRRLTVAAFGLDDAFHHLTVERGQLRPSDVEALEEMAPRNGEAGLQLAVRYARALDRAGVTRRFFRDFRARRDAVAEEWEGVPPEADRERAQLALLFLSRLTFLYFLQRRGALAGDDRYLPGLFGKWMGGVAGNGGRRGVSFYRGRLVPLFFGALNRRPANRDAEARALGDLPYLNGGLFERHAHERRFPDLDLPDAAVQACFDDLLERYRFTVRESAADAGHGVDPEILGRVFEGLMAPGERGDTGSFYTPAPVVDRVVREAVAAYVAGSCSPAEARSVVQGSGASLPAEARYRVQGALERIRVLDPACGSGAFLLGALHRVAVSLGGVSERADGDVRRQVVARSLHGVDLLDDAALLCSLRLWLALSADDDRVRPLPNLDRRIRQGDALVDPLDLGTLAIPGDGHPEWHPLRDPELRRALRAVEPAARRYLDSAPEDRTRARGQLDRVEGRLARRWVEGARQAHTHRLRSLRARAEDRDLFGQVPTSARQAAAAAERVGNRLRELDAIDTALAEKGALPFFSFGVHFADAAGGFDLIVSNPPWVRAHRWPTRLRHLCARYEVCRDPAWAGGARLTGAPGGAGAQVDLSLLFIERALRLLAPGGVLAVLVPAKAMRALYGGAARRMLLRELEFTLIEDHALDQRSIFRADAFAAVLIGRKRPPASLGAGAGPGPGSGPGSGPGEEVRVRLVRRNVEPLEFWVAPRELPLFPDDPSSPWLLAPPDALAVFRRMQAAGPPLGEHEGLRVRRGIMTGANDVLLFSKVEAKIGGLARVEAEGYRRSKRQGRSRGDAARFRGVVEMEGLRPLVRGADIDAFRYRTEGSVAWCHDGKAEAACAPPRLEKYLTGHRARLEARAGWREGVPLGAVFRLSAETLGPKVAWHDLSDTLRAVALPATVRVEGTDRELVPLNTVYFLPTPDHEQAVLMAGLLNSLPVRTMARALAERAKDARFRFFAWTISSLPLPMAWSETEAAAEIGEISRTAHRDGGLDPAAAGRLDRAAARLYGLSTADLQALQRFDAWLRGETPPSGEGP